MSAINVVSATPTLLTTAYSTGRVVGAALTFARLFDTSFAGVVTNVTVDEVGTQKSALSLIFFKSLPAAALADNVAPVFTAADMALKVAQVDIAPADYVTNGGLSVAEKEVNKLILGSSTDLVVVVVVNGTPTFAAANAMKITVGMVRL